MARDKITLKHLQSLIDDINTETGSPTEPYTDGKANVGNFHLSQCYGGVALHRMFNNSGAVSTPLGDGHGTKRELYTRLNMFLVGIRAGKQIK